MRPGGPKKIFLGPPPPPPPLISGCGGVYLPLRPGAILSVTTEFGDHHDKSASNWGHNTVEPRYNGCQGTDKIWFAITKFRYIRVYNGLLVRSKSFFISLLLLGSAGSRGGAWGARPPPLFLDQTESRRAPKNFFGRPGPPFLRVWWQPLPPPPPYLKVWIRHFWERENRSLDPGSTQQRAFHHFLNATRKNQNNSRLERSCS